jgi:hypothetical protein
LNKATYFFTFCGNLVACTIWLTNHYVPIECLQLQVPMSTQSLSAKAVPPQAVMALPSFKFTQKTKQWNECYSFLSAWAGCAHRFWVWNISGRDTRAPSRLRGASCPVAVSCPSATPGDDALRAGSRCCGRHSLHREMALRLQSGELPVRCATEVWTLHDVPRDAEHSSWSVSTRCPWHCW